MKNEGNESLNRKKDRILESAKKLFSVFGVRKTTVDEIAVKARIAKGTIYNHFSSKEEIYEEIARRESIAVLDRMKESVAEGKTSRECLKKMLMSKIYTFKEKFLFYKIEQDTFEDMLPTLMEIRDNFLREEEKLVRSIIVSGIESGEIDKVDFLEQLTGIVILSMKELNRPWVFEKSLDEVSGVAGKLVDVLFDGIASGKK